MEGNSAPLEDLAHGAESRRPARSSDADRIGLGAIAGPLVVFGALPPFVTYLSTCATRFGGALVWPLSREYQAAAPPPWPTAWALVVVFGWIALQAALAALLPGKVALGQPLADGTRLPYKLNGLLAFVLTWGALIAATWGGGLRLAVVYDAIGPLFAAASLVALASSLGLYALGGAARSGQAESAPRGAVAVFHAFFMGRALNPRVGAFDFKFFFESRPGLIGWTVIDVAFAAKQLELSGAVSWPMILVVAGQVVYVADYFLHEEAILTTWDIRHEHFGWMLCWGDMVWVPFTYSLQAAYLVTRAEPLPAWALVGIACLNVAGYAVFRGANIQKHHFRTDPERPIWGRKPEYIRTRRGTLLLTSGAWGLSRHLNYFGDLLMALAWCLPCGFSRALPYFYFVYLTILLVHRERRDHAACAAKYGEDWDAYCRKVRWRIVPGVY